MTDQIREQLSALLDGELPKDEMGLLVRRLEKDAALRRTFGMYALIGETLRAPGGRIASQSFAARVSAALDTAEGAAPAAARTATGFMAATGTDGRASPPDAAVAAVAPGAGVRHVALWQRPIVRTALAASAAAVAVMFFRPGSAPDVVSQLDPVPDASVAMLGASPTPAQSQRLASYMVAHSQYSTPLVRRNVLSSLLAADPGITRVSYEMGDAP